MSFEVGEVVTPVTNILNNAIEVPTTGEQGIVIARQKVGEDSEGNLYYIYQVRLDNVITFGTEENPQSGQVFWFGETDLGNTVPGGIVAVDESAVTSSVATAQSVTDSALSTITQVKDSVPSANAYYDSLKNYEELAAANSALISDSTIDSSDSSDLSRQGNALISQSDLTSTDSQILQELSENLYGFYTITAELENEIKQEQEQAQQQEELAVQEDNLTFETFINSFIDSPTVGALLVPDSEEPSKTVLGMESVDGLDSINPADLITESLDLESD